MTPVCDGDIYRVCATYRRCGDVNGRCVATGCEPIGAPPDAVCRWGTDVAICAGDYVLHCIGNARHYTSCSSIGFKGGCVLASGVGAKCAP
jgi:hypothetical protein